jgi:mono/diheme cytochrome c family protein
MTRSPLLLLLPLSACLTVRPPSTETIDRTPERVERGRYLTENIADCLGCHSPRDWTKPFGPIAPGMQGSGGEPMTARDGVPGSAVPGNLTPDLETGLGQATDGELIRAIREGVGHDGRALFPSMPYRRYRALSDDDVRAIVAYLRTLQPVKRARPETRIDFPVSLFIRGVPKPVDGAVATPVAEPERGHYLVTLAGCRDCHSPVDSRGRVVEGRAFAGGRVFEAEGFQCESPPLDASPGSKLQGLTRAGFIARFRTTTSPPTGNTVMPWPAFRGLSDDDLGAIYSVLTAQER